MIDGHSSYIPFSSSSLPIPPSLSRPMFTWDWWLSSVGVMSYCETPPAVVAVVGWVAIPVVLRPADHQQRSDRSPGQGDVRFRPVSSAYPFPSSHCPAMAGIDQGALTKQRMKMDFGARGSNLTQPKKYSRPSQILPGFMCGVIDRFLGGKGRH